VVVIVCLTCDRRDVCELSPHLRQSSSWTLALAYVSHDARPDSVDYAFCRNIAFGCILTLERWCDEQPDIGMRLW
jgi:hypothetical protein